MAAVKPCSGLFSYRASTPSRRRLLTGAAAVVTLLGAQAASAPVEGHELPKEPIVQPVTASEQAFIDRAFEMRTVAVARGDQAYGAVVVQDGVIVGQSWSRVILDQDPTAHAEMAAIRDAARRLGRRELSGMRLYASSRPCPMCEAAAYWAGIDRMIHGRAMRDAGAPRLCR